MKIAIGSDHGGFNLKNEVVKHLKELGYEVADFGTHSKDSVNYAEFGYRVANAVASGQFEKGIVICGTGIGISMAANKVKGIRCALCGDVFSAKATRQHNDANMLAMGERVLGVGLALEIVDAFLNAEYEGGRHAVRVETIMNIEQGKFPTLEEPVWK